MSQRGREKKYETAKQAAERLGIIDSQLRQLRTCHTV
jgi:hypothetical protein